MEIQGQITGIKYKICLPSNLQNINFEEFEINKAPTSCILTKGSQSFAISRWVSPKRTHSYPYERVYNTLSISKKITVIPIIKDEGMAGDRYFIQWETISLMSLLDVFVIFAYYEKADRRGQKITKQQFSNEYILKKIAEIEQYHSSALHWNLHELSQNLHIILDKATQSYTKIEALTGIKLHDFKGIENFKCKIGQDVSEFMEFSRGKAKKAQSREFTTIQPKESLSTLSKVKITITNFLGGQYFFTIDEVYLFAGKLQLIEGKHSKTALLPSKSDIKDGLVKMILYSNLCNTTVNDKKVICTPILSLTSVKLKGEISTHSTQKELEEFFKINSFNQRQRQLVTDIITETKSNNFTVLIKNAK